MQYSSDRSTKTLLTLLVIGVWGLLIAHFFKAPTVDAQPRVKWDYTYSKLDEIASSELDQYGDEGWEVIAITASKQALMKRQK